MFANKVNNVVLKLGAGLSVTTNLLVIAEGKETLLGGDFAISEIEKYFKLTLVKFSGKTPIQIEIVKVIAKNGKNLTIERAVEPCPLNLNAKELSRIAYEFGAGDSVFLNLTTGDLKQISDILNSKLNSKGGLRTGMPKKPAFSHIDTKGNETLLEYDPIINIGDILSIGENGLALTKPSGGGMMATMSQYIENISAGKLLGLFAGGTIEKSNQVAGINTPKTANINIDVGDDNFLYLSGNGTLISYIFGKPIMGEMFPTISHDNAINIDIGIDINAFAFYNFGEDKLLAIVQSGAGTSVINQASFYAVLFNVNKEAKNISYIAKQLIVSGLYNSAGVYNFSYSISFGDFGDGKNFYFGHTQSYYGTDYPSSSSCSMKISVWNISPLNVFTEKIITNVSKSGTGVYHYRRLTESCKVESGKSIILYKQSDNVSILGYVLNGNSSTPIKIDNADMTVDNFKLSYLTENKVLVSNSSKFGFILSMIGNQLNIDNVNKADMGMYGFALKKDSSNWYICSSLNGRINSLGGRTYAFLKDFSLNENNIVMGGKEVESGNPDTNYPTIQNIKVLNGVILQVLGAKVVVYNPIDYPAGACLWRTHPKITRLGGVFSENTVEYPSDNELQINPFGSGNMNGLFPSKRYTRDELGLVQLSGGAGTTVSDFFAVTPNFIKTKL